MARQLEPLATSAQPATPGLGLRQRFALLLAVVGPGLITGIVDDDPTGIAGYSLAGARYGYLLLWTLIPITIALAVVQEMAARMGTVTGKGLAALIRERFGVRVTAVAMIAQFLANVATTIAEFAGIAAASEIFGVSRYISIPIAAVVIYLIVAYGSYRRVELVLLTGSLVFISYIITGFVARPDWGAVARHTVVPSVRLNVGYFTMLIGVIGTSITTWMQFYLQSTVVDKGVSRRDYWLERLDAYFGSIASNVIAFFIIVTCAATLFAHGLPAGTVTDVAQALRPLAGGFASKLFAIGLLNASLMAAAVLPLSASYTMCEAFGWESSVNRPVREAPVFFGLFAGLLVVGAAAVLVPGLPLLMLMFIPNVVEGILLPLILILMLRLVSDRRIMGSFVNTVRQNAIAWTTAVVMIALTAAYVVIAVLQATGVLLA